MPKTTTPRRPLTAQQIFTKVATHLLKQNAKSQSTKLDDDCDYPCRYHGPKGLSCAVGCLIPRTISTRPIEDQNVDVLLGVHAPAPAFAPTAAKRIAEQCGLTIEHRELLKELQLTHDSYSVERWPARLKTVAASFDLDMPKILQEALA